MSAQFQLPDGYSVRAATMDDADAATDLFNAAEIDESGEPDYAPGEVAQDWVSLELAERVALIELSNGSLAGSMMLRSRENVVHETDIYVHPDHQGRGLGAYLITLSEARALSWVNSAPAGKRVVLRNFVNGGNPRATTLLESMGYQAIRHFWRMEVTFDQEPPAPKVPDGFEIRPVREGVDERAIYETVNEAFKDHWSFGPSNFEEWFRDNKGERYDPSLWFQLFEGQQMAGAVVAKVNPDGKGWVNDLAVRRPWRKRGLGEFLLKHVFHEFYQRGIRRVGLGVDAQNTTGATRLYERAGMSITRNFVIYEKELRPGEPWEE